MDITEEAAVRSVIAESPTPSPSPSRKGGELGQGFGDDVAVAEIDGTALAAGDGEAVVDAQQVVHRGQQVLGADGTLVHVAAVLVRGADHVAPRDARAGDVYEVLVWRIPDAEEDTFPFDVWFIGLDFNYASVDLNRIDDSDFYVYEPDE